MAKCFHIYELQNSRLLLGKSKLIFWQMYSTD